jgi:hypothetical protein
VRRIDVVKKGDNWVGRSGGKTVRGTKANTKQSSVKKTAAVAREGQEADVSPDPQGERPDSGRAHVPAFSRPEEEQGLARGIPLRTLPEYLAAG